MRLCPKTLALTGGLLWGLAFLLTALANLAWPGYGNAFLELMASVYPGYDPVGGGGVVVGTLYAVVDGLLGGLVFAWAYNRIGRAVGSIAAV